MENTRYPAGEGFVNIFCGPVRIFSTHWRLCPGCRRPGAVFLGRGKEPVDIQGTRVGPADLLQAVESEFAIALKLRLVEKLIGGGLMGEWRSGRGVMVHVHGAARVEHGLDVEQRS